MDYSPRVGQAYGEGPVNEVEGLAACISGESTYMIPLQAATMTQPYPPSGTSLDTSWGVGRELSGLTLRDEADLGSELASRALERVSDSIEALDIQDFDTNPIPEPDNMASSTSPAEGPLSADMMDDER